MREKRATSNATNVVVIGASGFIGEHLLAVLANKKDIELRVLVHSNRATNYDNINFIEGDLLKPDSLDALLSKNCTVINLAYLAHDNLDAMVNLAMACAKKQVRRLIHCSTAVVAGRSRTDLVTEETPCVPISLYEQTKLQIEDVLLEMAIGKFEIAILRPTAVFGPGGKNLLKLAHELMTAHWCVNYIRSCIFNRRSMNLVCVDNVVAALIFLLDAEKIDQETFIISDDDSIFNNYRDIENRLFVTFGKPYPIPRVSVPNIFLSVLLRLTGKSDINPLTKYSDQKLAAQGFKKSQNLEEALDVFAAWYKKSHITESVRHVI